MNRVSIDPPRPRGGRWVAVLGMTVWVLLLNGCAGYRAFRGGQADLADGKVESGIAKLREASDHDPENLEYRRVYFAQRDSAAGALLRRAELATDAGDFDEARNLYSQVQKIDVANARAAVGITKVDAAERQSAALDSGLLMARKGEVDAAVVKVQQVLSENPNHMRASLLLKQLLRQQADKTGKDLGIYPKLKEAYRKPVSMSFSGATLQQVFDALKQASGLNYVLDKDVRMDQRVVLSVTSKPVEDVLRLLMATNQLERRVLDEDTLLIYPNTPAKAAEYREMVVRTFYLNNAEAAKVATLLRTIAKAKDVVVDDKLNLLIVRDSAEVIRLAEKLVATQDVVEPEVMLELEVLEVSVNRLVDMGISWPSSVSASVSGAKGVAGQLTLDELRNRNTGMLSLNISDPVIAAKLRSQNGNSNLLANPRVRVRNKQSAKILIGERVPVFTTTTTANVGSSESVNYLDVGLKLDIEPTVSVDNDVSMKLALEVSNIIDTITRTSGTQAYRLGTRNTSTTLRVHDGETNVLAGLIQRNEQRSNTGIPGLNQLPILSRLFGQGQDSDSRTEIILLVTPHIVRNIEPPGLGLQEFLSGTDSAIGATPIQFGSPMGAATNVQGGAARSTGGASPATPQQVPVAPPAAALPVPPPQPLLPAATVAPPTPAQPPALTQPPLVPTAPGTVPTQSPNSGAAAPAATKG